MSTTPATAFAPPKNPAPLLARMRASLARIEAMPEAQRARHSRDEAELVHMIALATMLEDAAVKP